MTRRTEVGTLDVAVVEDEPITRTLVAKTLATRGHRVETFACARAALLAIERGQHHAVVSDLSMPGLTGDELCRQLRTRLGAKAPPVVMLSGADDEERVGRALDAGAWHYVKKPFAPGELIAIVERAGRAALRAASATAALSGTGRFALLADDRPERLGPYRIVDELGRGGMGIVYRARRETDGVEAALKVLAPGSLGIEDQLRFRRELDLLASLEHPGIARLLEAGSDSGRAWYAMELVPGRTLAREIHERGWLEPMQVARIGRDLAATLAFVHGRRIVHRDVKPANVVLAPSGTARLVDFGLARRPMDLALTGPAEVVGTPLYLAPELAESNVVPTPASDVYALGLTLHEALAGTHPHGERGGENALATLLRHVREPIAPLRSRVPHVPHGVAALVDRAVSRDPLVRPSAAELARGLARALAQEVAA